MACESRDTAQSTEKAAKHNGQAQKGKPRVMTNPNDVAGLVMMQIDTVNTKKDELTIAVKGLSDTAKQLVRAYRQQTAVIQKLQRKIQELEGNAESKADASTAKGSNHRGLYMTPAR